MKLLLKHKADPTQKGWVRIQDKLRQVSPLELANHYLNLHDKVKISNFFMILNLKARYKDSNLNSKTGRFNCIHLFGIVCVKIKSDAFGYNFTHSRHVMSGYIKWLALQSVI
jgi:hypothetical protein